MSVERLKIERDERRDSITGYRGELQSIQADLSQLRRELTELEDWWAEQLEARTYATRVEGGKPAGLDGLPRSIERLESERWSLKESIREAEIEISAINDVLKTKAEPGKGSSPSAASDSCDQSCTGGGTSPKLDPGTIQFLLNLPRDPRA